jgi:hypothetical protein
MIAVAITSLLLGATRLWMWERECRRQAQVQAALEAQSRAQADWALRMFSKGYASPKAESEARAQAEHHARLKVYYERAVFRPWMPVPGE